MKKHKKNMRTYENCFSSTDAIDWLHKSLQKNPNFGADVSKEQTTLLLKKLYRAGIIENVREEADDEEFKVSGELYRFSNKSPAKNLRTPGKGERKPLGDTANTPRHSGGKDAGKSEAASRERSANRKVKEEMKKQLNLSYFQALPSNSLIILDNDDTWRRVYLDQLSRCFTTKNTERIEYAGQLDMDNVMHNMTRVSAKGIVQVDDKSDDLPHWVLSAMKCLANWPKQLKTMNGKESCLPSYPGFEHDVFNVVKDYFLQLSGPLTTVALYEFLVEAFAQAEGNRSPHVPVRQVRRPGPAAMKHMFAPSGDAQRCPSQGTIADPAQSTVQSRLKQPCLPSSQDTGEADFFTMTDQQSLDFSVLSHQERVARIRQTFQVLPPLATSSSNSGQSHPSTNLTHSTLSGHTTCETISPFSLSPDMSTTALMKQFLPPNTCFETAFVAESPITRIVPQKEHETLHIKRSWSGRSLSHIPTDWATKSTQTDGQQGQSESVWRKAPKWKRTSRFRKSIAIMETQDRRKSASNPAYAVSNNAGIVNTAYSTTPDVSLHPSAVAASVDTRARLQSADQLSTVTTTTVSPMRGYASVDNLVHRENTFEEQFMLKYRQVSGDLRSSCDLVQLSQRRAAEEAARDKSLIHSKAVRKEKKKKRFRTTSSSGTGGYDTDSDVRYEPRGLSTPSDRFCFVNRGLEVSPRAQATGRNPPKQLQPQPTAPLALHEISDLSPVVFSRQTKYNTSYRLATNQGSTPASKYSLPRTSTHIDLLQGPSANNNNNLDKEQRCHLESKSVGCLYVRAEPYNCINSDASSQLAEQVVTAPSVQTDRITGESLYTCVRNDGIEPLRRYAAAAPGSFRRSVASRMSRLSQATTVDSGRFSDCSRASAHDKRLATALSDSAVGAASSRYSKTVPHTVLVDRLNQLAYQTSGAESLEERATAIFKLLTLLIPPPNRRKLQLLLKFIRKVSLNSDLSLDSTLTNRELSLNTFTAVILRPTQGYGVTRITQTERKITRVLLDCYEEVWNPPQTLRREVEEKVYLGLVNRRLQAGEDPYPITYCKQVTKDEYEKSKLTGAQTALLDLLQAILTDKKMSDKERTKKLKKFKDSYPDLWRRKYPSESSEPILCDNTTRREKPGKFSSLSRIKSVMGM